MTRPYPIPSNTNLATTSLDPSELASSPSCPGNGSTSNTRVLGKSPLHLAMGTVDVDDIETRCDCSWGCAECDPTTEFKLPTEGR